MGTAKKKGDGSSSNNNAQIPAASKKIVQRLKEILNDKSCTDLEIYSALKDSNMDPNEAIQRLFSQDTFKEVKSKREKRKEMKETRELKTQEKNSDTSYAVEVGEEHSDGVASSVSHTNFNDYDQSIYKRDNMLDGSVPSSTLLYRVKTSKQQPSPHSDTLNNECTRQSSENMDNLSSGNRPAETLVARNRGTPYSCNVTMADIVRMGKPPRGHSQKAAETTYTRQDSNSQLSSFNHLKSSHDSSHSRMGMWKDQQGADSANVSQMNHEFVIVNSERNFTNEWPGIEQQTSVSGSSILNNFRNEWPSIEPNSYDGTKFPVRVDGDVGAKDTSSTCLTSVFPSDGQEALDVGAAEGYSEILSCKVIPNYLPPDDVSHLRGLRNSISPPANNTVPLNDKVSSNSVDSQKPILGKEEPRTAVSEDTSVVFPNYVQDISSELSHLSFGTYHSGVSTTVSESLTSDSLKNNLKEGLSALADPFDPRNSWYADQILRCKKLGLDKESRDNVFPRFSQSESQRPSIPQPQAPIAYEYTSSSVPDSNYMNKINPDARNPPLHRALQSSSLPATSEVLAAAYSSLLDMQSASSRYSSAVPSSVDPVIMSEALNSSVFSLPVSYSLPLPGVSLPMGSALPRSAPQHSYQDTGVFHDSLAGIKRSVPQFGAGTFRNGCPPSGFNDFADGDLGSPTNLPRQFHHDIPSARSAVGYGGVQSRYNEDTRLTMLQQARNSQLSAWDYGSSMRAVPSVLGGRNHSLPAQNQLLFSYPQARLMRNSEAMGHSNVYHSQARTMQDQQLRPAGLPFSQAQSPRLSDQFWQQRYQR